MRVYYGVGYSKRGVLGLVAGRTGPKIRVRPYLLAGDVVCIRYPPEADDRAPVRDIVPRESLKSDLFKTS
jgi:hypothetical protein